MSSFSSSGMLEKLRLEGYLVSPLASGDDNGWLVKFGEKSEYAGTSAMLLLQPDHDYLICVAPITSDALKVRTLDELSAKTLQKLLEMNSRVRLAKLEQFKMEDETVFYATSDCSTDKLTGPKLSARLEACARLAALVAQGLE